MHTEDSSLHACMYMHKDIFLWHTRARTLTPFLLFRNSATHHSFSLSTLYALAFSSTLVCNGITIISLVRISTCQPFTSFSLSKKSLICFWTEIAAPESQSHTLHPPFSPSLPPFPSYLFIPFTSSLSIPFLHLVLHPFREFPPTLSSPLLLFLPPSHQLLSLPVLPSPLNFPSTPFSPSLHISSQLSMTSLISFSSSFFSPFHDYHYPSDFPLTSSEPPSCLCVPPFMLGCIISNTPLQGSPL